MQAPLPPAVTKRKPASISMMVWRTAPRLNRRPGAAGQAVHAGRHRGEVLGVLAAEPGGLRDQQPVVREHHRLMDVGHPVDQVVHQPGDVDRRARVAAPLGHPPSSVAVGRRFGPRGSGRRGVRSSPVECIGPVRPAGPHRCGRAVVPDRYEAISRGSRPGGRRWPHRRCPRPAVPGAGPALRPRIRGHGGGRTGRCRGQHGGRPGWRAGRRCRARAAARAGRTASARSARRAGRSAGGGRPRESAGADATGRRRRQRWLERRGTAGPAAPAGRGRGHGAVAVRLGQPVAWSRAGACRRAGRRWPADRAGLAAAEALRRRCGARRAARSAGAGSPAASSGRGRGVARVVVRRRRRP